MFSREAADEAACGDAASDDSRKLLFKLRPRLAAQLVCLVEYEMF